MNSEMGKTATKKDISADSEERIKEFFEDILNPSDMSTKEIEGEPITGSDLMNSIKAYNKILQGDDLPEPRSILHANIEAQNKRAVSDSLELYRQKMAENIGGNYIQSKKLNIFHKKAFMEAIEYFNKGKKIGGKESLLIYKKQLEIKMNEEFSIYQKQNKGNIEAQNKRAVRDSMELYHQKMAENIDGNYIKIGKLKIFHEKAFMESIEYFNKKTKIGGKESSLIYGKQLRIKMNETFSIYQKQNKTLIEILQQELKGLYSKAQDKVGECEERLRKWILKNEKKLQDIVGEAAIKYLKWILIIVAGSYAVFIIWEFSLVPILFRILKSINTFEGLEDNGELFEGQK